MVDKKNLKEIAKQVVAYLVTLPVGTEISTWKATKNSYGIDNLEDIDLFEINKQLPKIAKEKGLELDGSKYNDCVVGLPFNIPFVIKHIN